MAHDRQIGHPTLDVVPQPARRPAVHTDWVDRDRGAEQVREFASHGGVGDGHPEFDGAADGVGEQAGGSVQGGSWGVRCACENLHLHTPQDPYILCLTASPENPRYALWIRKGR